MMPPADRIHLDPSQMHKTTTTLYSTIVSLVPSLRQKRNG